MLLVCLAQGGGSWLAGCVHEGGEVVVVVGVLVQFLPSSKWQAGGGGGLW